MHVRNGKVYGTDMLSELKGTGTESQQLEVQTWDLFENLELSTNYTPNKVSLAQTSDETSCAESTSSNPSIYVEEEQSSSVEYSTSSCTGNTDCSPSRKVPKRKALEDMNTHFIEAASFKEMCSTVTNRKQQPTEDELFGQRVLAFIGSITDEDAKNDAKAAVMKYLADCVSAQYD
ncbi:hypothetical protein FQA39_LY06049 [Lamprigera yunnana]|nr:hypothetical protein FQA39_LY06049 [Lamprigera yunnana]